MPDLETFRPLEILPHPLRGTMTIGSERIMPVWCQIRAAEDATDEKPIIAITGTDGSEDRHGTPIESTGWNFTPYRDHPVALWQHGEVKHWPYVGVTNDLRSGGGSKWDFSIELLTNQWRHLDVNMAAFLWETYRDFNIAALSVAFIPKTWEPYEATGIPSFFSEGVRYKTQELTEVSFVNVPSNRNAVAKTFEKWRGMGRGEGLARMLGYEISPIIIRTQPEEKMPEPIATPEPEAKRAPSAFRALLKSSVVALRCGGYYDDYYDPANYCPLCGARLGTCNDAETVTPEDASAEQATITAMIGIKTQQLSIALDGWASAEHDALRSYCSSAVYDAMWQVERAWQFAEYWYDDLIGVAEPTVTADAMRAFTDAVTKDPVELKRAGAEFSSKNKKTIQAIHDHATEIASSCANMLSMSADDTTIAKSVDQPQEYRITGLPSPDRDEDVGQTFRVVSVADEPDAGAGNRSKPAAQPSLYDAKALPVRR